MCRVKGKVNGRLALHALPYLLSWRVQHDPNYSLKRKGINYGKTSENPYVSMALDSLLTKQVFLSFSLSVCQEKQFLVIYKIFLVIE